MFQFSTIGRFAADPKRVEIPNGYFVSFTLAVNLSKERVLFVSFHASGCDADTIIQHCKKGTPIFATGTVYNLTTFTSKSGEVKPDLNCKLDHFSFISSKPKDKTENKTIA